MPEDVSVLGFDDVSPARFSFPSLTTIRQDVQRLGGPAAASLLDAPAEDHPIPAERTLVPVELVVRDSTAEARS